MCSFCDGIDSMHSVKGYDISPRVVKTDAWASASGWCIEFETPDENGWTTTQIEITHCPMCGKELGAYDE